MNKMQKKITASVQDTWWIEHLCVSLRGSYIATPPVEGSLGDPLKKKRTKQHSGDEIGLVFQEQYKRVDARMKAILTGQDRREDGAQDIRRVSRYDHQNAFGLGRLEPKERNAHETIWRFKAFYDRSTTMSKQMRHQGELVEKLGTCQLLNRCQTTWTKWRAEVFQLSGWSDIQIGGKG